MFRYLPFVLLAPAAMAQPALDVSLLPAQGLVYGYHDVPWITPPKGGDNMKWDLSALPKGTVVPYAVHGPQLAPGAGAFPATATVLQVPGEPAAYFQIGDTALFWLGTASEDDIVRFDPPIPWVRRPTRMRDRWKDSTLVAVTGGGRIELRITQYTVTADGFGTLVMPYGVVPDALRLKHELRVRNKRDPDAPEMWEVRYSWWVPSCPMPLVIISERSGWGPPDRVVRWLDGSWRTDPLSLFQPIKLKVFPDPCDELLTVDLPAERPGHTILQIVDASGAVVKQWTVEFTSPERRRLVLEVGDLPGGHYTLNWRDSNGTLGNARLQVQ